MQIYDDKDLIGEGTRGKIYKVGSEAHKIFKPHVSYDKKLDLLTKIKELYLNKSYPINEFIFDENHKLLGYTMPIIYTDKDILTEDISYLKRSFEELKEDMSILAKNNIIADDINAGSFLASNDSIKVVDGDEFYFAEYLKENEIYRYNRRELINAFSSYIAYLLEVKQMNNEILVYDPTYIQDLIIAVFPKIEADQITCNLVDYLDRKSAIRKMM